jgi:hypothetical protein
MIRTRVLVGSGADVGTARRDARVAADVLWDARLMNVSLQNHIGRLKSTFRSAV